MQNRQFFESGLPEQLFELKNDGTIKKSENLRDICTSYGLSINTMHGPIQSRETVLLNAEYLLTLMTFWYTSIFMKLPLSKVYKLAPYTEKKKFPHI